ncbi:SAF domain-containing protein [Microbacterium sp. KUDC0406]|uniref:SAF domain-containing protein n=1 Tax=Microbacterium sp. KUDC0406 TaxID=2909588 RepID=UPI001F4670FE|nr:SAF domain-containing protein [Microbacterium sp. KUDC0406]UJP11435.1 SAF domain-containing protein [Microbacterium sp. KUDC0406]
MTTHTRTRRPFYGDLRFLIGIALVIASVAGVWLLVGAARQTTPVLQASRTIVPGEPLGSSDFQVVEVGLGPLTDDYLAPQDLEPGMIAVRTIDDGELVPRSGTADADAGRTTAIVITSTGAIPASVKAGSTVELWQAPPSKDGRSFGDPRILVADAVVASVAEPEGMLSDARTDVEVVVDRADVADVLSAMNGGAAVSVIPAGPGE